MTRSAIQHCKKYDTDIHFDPTDLVSFNVDDRDREIAVYWGIDDDGRCFFIVFIDNEYYDGLTEEA